MVEDGRSVALAAMERINYSSTVNIIITNKTSHFLHVRKEWVRGGEGIVRPLSKYFFSSKTNKQLKPLISKKILQDGEKRF